MIFQDVSPKHHNLRFFKMSSFTIYLACFFVIFIAIEMKKDTFKTRKNTIICFNCEFVVVEQY